MAELESGIERRKRIAAKAAMIFIVAITFLTFFSKSINNFLLPQVDTVKITKGSIGDRIEKIGEVEILNKDKIYVSGLWKVKDVYVKKNEQVRKGTVLALVEKEDLSVEIKRSELDILKFENALEQYINSFKEITIKELERSIDLSKRRMDDTKANLATLRELYNAGVETRDNLDKAQREYDDALYDYNDKLGSMDRRKQEYETSVKEKRFELNLMKMELGKLKKNFSNNGEIISQADGVVLEVNIEKGTSTQPGQPIFVIGLKDAKYRIAWALNTEESSKFSVGDKVNISLEVQSEKKEAEKETISIEELSIYKEIEGREFLKDSKQYKYWADIELEEGKAVEGQKADIMAVKYSKTYEILVPRNCVTEKLGSYSLFVLKERRGALGIERYVEEVEAEVLDNDNYYCAIEAPLQDIDEIIVNATRPLVNGMQVR